MRRTCWITARLVPVACSASHVGCSAFRLEPTWTALGEAAGVAAHVAAMAELPVQDVDVAAVQSLLHGEGAKTVYVPDVEPGNAGFRAVQALGQRGAFHGLHNPQNAAESDPQRIYGQYLPPWPGHPNWISR